jgi:hypothetical protein
MIPRYTGVDADGVARTESDHLRNCPVCGACVDMRDLGQVLAHIHDAEIGICEGPDSPRREGPLRSSCSGSERRADCTARLIFFGGHGVHRRRGIFHYKLAGRIAPLTALTSPSAALTLPPIICSHVQCMISRCIVSLCTGGECRCQMGGIEVRPPIADRCICDRAPEPAFCQG